MEKILKNRGLAGDNLLDALDIIDDIVQVGGVVTDEGYAIMYHRTNIVSAGKIISQQKMLTMEDAVFMSTHHDKQIIGYGDTIVQLKIPVENLELDDDFGDELHYKITCGFRSEIKIQAEIIGE